MSFDRAASEILVHFSNLPGLARLRKLMPDADFDESTVAGILDAAGRYASEVLEPFGRGADEKGCTLREGRVVTPTGQIEAWRGFAEGGWPTIEAPVEFGGSGLPLAVHSACEELFNRGSAAFGMLATPTRCAVRLLDRYASQPLKEEWLSKLIAGEWSGTICISEPDAGSDLARVRSTATALPDGTWSVTGEKIWISFGDHDLTPRIGHMLLARTPGAPPGTSGLSLFLVPSAIGEARNGVVTRRIEEKLGLHVSPTCALGFEEAQGWLVGELNRGLPQLFTMIIGMRISVGSQGAAIAAASSDIALGYAAERRQGGSAKEPPVAIERHGDVQRMLLEMAAKAEVSRGLVLLTSIISDLAEREDKPEANQRAGDLLGWLLPITKNFCAEAAFANASDAIQVLGGAGYTREWPAEQYLRDARVLSIYEGTTAMQALDLLLRRVLGGTGGSLTAFLAAVDLDVSRASNLKAAETLQSIVGSLQEATAFMRDQAGFPDVLQAGATAFLRLASLATTGWVALRLTELRGGEVERRIAARGRHWLGLLHAFAAREIALIQSSGTLLAEFAEAK
jgi:hypothetical protein